MQYRAYLGSKKWKRKRRRYFSRHHRACAACGSEVAVTLHHMTYERFGDERDEDLLPLCRMHHDLLHRLYPRTCPENSLLFLFVYQTPDAAALLTLAGTSPIRAPESALAG